MLGCHPLTADFFLLKRRFLILINGNMVRAEMEYQFGSIVRSSMNGVKWIVLLSILWVDQKAKQRFLALVEQNEVTNGQLDWIKNNFFFQLLIASKNKISESSKKICRTTNHMYVITQNIPIPSCHDINIYTWRGVINLIH